MGIIVYTIGSVLKVPSKSIWDLNMLPCVKNSSGPITGHIVASFVAGWGKQGSPKLALGMGKSEVGVWGWGCLFYVPLFMCKLFT